MSNQHYNGDVTFTCEGRKYTATVKATASYYFRKGRMYMANGDPGYPDEEDFEIDDIDVTEVKDWDTEEPVDYDEDKMYDPIYDALEKVEWVDDDPDECEPDADYYEERAIARWEDELSRCGY